jgi:hypothetical protein
VRPENLEAVAIIIGLAVGMYALGVVLILAICRRNDDDDAGR